MTHAPPPIHDELSTGVFLNNRTMKHWVEKESMKNCFMIYARGVSITWAENNSYWQWLTEKDAPSDDAPVEMAELLNVCWLDVHGRFDVSKLSMGTTYEVAFVILMRSSADGWQIPVNIRLTLPDGTKQEHTENLMEKPRRDWIEIKAGELSTTKHKEGEMEVSMFEHATTPRWIWLMAELLNMCWLDVHGSMCRSCPGDDIRGSLCDVDEIIGRWVANSGEHPVDIAGRDQARAQGESPSP
ncbi:LOW QUALITY PROTEIN: hypothetical protein EUGRSUZ_E01885 [Eucalyptus grandis]|uniref:Uncharacterized protein n=1 Tax=Eucalyptus grandis TaxID=71139 RepID=A0ACC3KVQ5_EUCGR|nr:LOW QUALITY PROTEIN: hypothetical protein EUGRSUZ_E01885 [Eucalyptus grandis]